MAIMSSIQAYPMQFLMPQFSPALSANPEIAKAAQYGGSGGGGGGGVQTAPVAGQTPVAGGVTPQANGAAPNSGLLASIAKILGGGGGQGTDAIMSFLAGL